MLTRTVELGSKSRLPRTTVLNPLEETATWYKPGSRFANTLKSTFVRPALANGIRIGFRERN